MSGIRTNAAAALLGVSPNTLRSWERRFGYPRPARTPGGHRQYEFSQLESLRRALLETHNISSAIAIASQRGEGPSSPARLLEAFDRFDEAAADLVLEESLAVRSLERSLEEILLRAIELAAGREGREAEYELGCRWATGWLHAARRLVPPATRPQAVILFDSSARLDADSVHVQALELTLRRAAFRSLLLSADLPPERIGRALRALHPIALVFAGGGATLDAIGRLVYAARRVGSSAPVLDYRDAVPVNGSHAIPSLGSSPVGATERLRRFAEDERLVPSPARRAGDPEPARLRVAARG